jgi:phosphonate transport system substrate-binding protein
MTTRRAACLIIGSILLLAAQLAGASPTVGGQPLRIGLTPVFLDDQDAFLNTWRAYLEQRLGRPVVFYKRGSYRDISQMLQQGKLDFAWTCGLPYVRHRDFMRLLAVPVYHGEPLYQSYLIVPATDRTTRSVADLRGQVFAFSDPDSNSGFLYPTYALTRLGENSGSFFKKTFFTWAHSKVVEAVGVGLAQGGAVDGYVWDTLALYHPELTGKTRIVEKSPKFGHTPFVARAFVPDKDFRAMQGVLLAMASDPEGRGLLERLNLDGFTRGNAQLFDGIAAMARAVDAI